MTVTAHDVRHVTFGRPSLGRRGYAEDDVDPFLESVAASIEEQEEQITALQKKIEILLATQQPEPPTAPIPVVREEPEVPVGVEVAEILRLATETADRYKREAEEQAERSKETAAQAAQKILAEARKKAEAMIVEARTTGDEVLAEYEKHASDLEVMMRGLRDNLVPYFQKNLEDLDRLVPADAPAGSHAQE